MAMCYDTSVDVTVTNTSCHPVSARSSVTSAPRLRGGLWRRDMLSKGAQARFWGKVDKRGQGECWMWVAGTAGGYGVFWTGSKIVKAHRLSWEMANERAVPDGLSVLHSCDTPGCVSPSHLRVGTQRDNIGDMDKRGRRRCAIGDNNGSRKHPESRPRGEAHRRSKLRLSDVVEIRARAAAGETQQSLADAFGVRQTAISKIVNRETWAHVE